MPQHLFLQTAPNICFTKTGMIKQKALFSGGKTADSCIKIR